ncbi:MAG: hypothetical protein CMO01_12470 [Thalassobius sp.]|nr:hypothetical protein [Thalassovita sp.]|tara:strand:- start:401 stop:700 length:300 start_codon:yes stop_codon:yes gene_type:complete
MKKINNRLVEGVGFKVEMPNYHILMYYEGERVIELGLVDTNNALGNVTMVPFSKPRWGLNYSIDFLSEEEKERVKTRVGKALNLLGVKHKFDTNDALGN